MKENKNYLKNMHHTSRISGGFLLPEQKICPLMEILPILIEGLKYPTIDYVAYRLSQISPVEFKKLSMGTWVDNRCSVRNGKGNYCQNVGTVSTIRDGIEVWLCPDCYKNYMSGAYGIL